MFLLILGGAAYLICLGIFIWSMARAPSGYQDETGFHFDDPQRTDDHIDRPLTPGHDRKDRAAAWGRLRGV